MHAVFLATASRAVLKATRQAVVSSQDGLQSIPFLCALAMQSDLFL